LPCQTPFCFLTGIKDSLTELSLFIDKKAIQGGKMKNKQLTVFFVLVLLLTGFIGYSLINRNPPMPSVKTEGNNDVPVRQGSYCWSGILNGKCVDMVEPFMMSNRKAVPVVPGEKITITFNKVPREKSETISTWKEGADGPEDVPLLNGNTYLAPNEKGVYAISTDNVWRRGSASHLFFIEVR
jgi:hypothetical protein